MDNQAYITSKPLTQPVSSPLTPDFIEQLARSPWPPDGARLVLKTLDALEAEWAEADAARRSAAPQVCGGTAPSADAPPPAGPITDPSLGQVPAGHALQAQRLGMRIIHRLRVYKATNLARLTRVKAAKPTRVKKAAKPVARPIARSRATHSKASHGGARKAAAGDGDGDGGKPPSRWRRRRKPERKRRGPRQIEVGWTRFNQFPSSMGRKVAPGECNYASSAALMVAVIGPKHDQQTGSIRTVRSVSTGKVTTVVLGALVETHERVPISFYKFRRTSPSTPEAIAVRS
jgi:hypothetical protein